MANTTNPTLTSSWSLLVPLGSDFLLTLPFSTSTEIEVATTSSDSVSPTVSGHILSGALQEPITRSLLGLGAVWVRAKKGTVSVVLNTWVP